jgi:DNA-directed RNA polymerase subunit L
MLFFGHLPGCFPLHRVEVTEDTKIPNAATIKIVKQDHTLGNMIRGCVLSFLV